MQVKVLPLNVQAAQKHVPGAGEPVRSRNEPGSNLAEAMVSMSKPNGEKKKPAFSGKYEQVPDVGG